MNNIFLKLIVFYKKYKWLKGLYFYDFWQSLNLVSEFEAIFNDKLFQVFEKVSWLKSQK